MSNGIQRKMDSTCRVDYEKKSYGIAGIITLAVLLAVQLVIFLVEVIISLKAYSPVRGISGSSWVGLKNFRTVFTSMAFERALQNTIAFNLIFGIIIFAITVAVGYIITALPRHGICRDILSVLFIFPLFLPAEVYANWLITLFRAGLFINPAVMRFMHPLFSAIKYSGIPIMIIYILDEISEGKDSLLVLKAAGLFALVCLAFIGNSCFSLTKAIYNPMSYSTLDMIDTLSFRQGMQGNNMGANSVLEIIQTILSSLSFVLLFIPIRSLFSATFKKSVAKNVSENRARKIISSIIALVIFSAIYFLPYIADGQPFNMGMMKSSVVFPIVNYLILSLVSASVAAVLAAIIGRSFANHNKRLVFSAIILLILITIITANPISVSQYLVLKGMHLINTGFAIIFTTCFSAAAVWAMACILTIEDNISSRHFFIAMAGILLIQAAAIYCNPTPPSIYFTNPRLSPILIFKGINSGVQGIKDLSQRVSIINTAGLYGFILSLPPLILFLAAKIALPKRYLISIISGGMKN